MAADLHWPAEPSVVLPMAGRAQYALRLRSRSAPAHDHPRSGALVDCSVGHHASNAQKFVSGTGLQYSA